MHLSPSHLSWIVFFLHLISQLNSIGFSIRTILRLSLTCSFISPGNHTSKKWSESKGGDSRLSFNIDPCKTFLVPLSLVYFFCNVRTIALLWSAALPSRNKWRSRIRYILGIVQVNGKTYEPVHKPDSSRTIHPDPLEGLTLLQRYSNMHKVFRLGAPITAWWAGGHGTIHLVFYQKHWRSLPLLLFGCLHLLAVSWEADPEIFPFLSPNIIHRNWQFPHSLAGDITAGFYLEQMTNGVINLVWKAI